MLKCHRRRRRPILRFPETGKTLFQGECCDSDQTMSFRSNHCCRTVLDEDEPSSFSLPRARPLVSGAHAAGDEDNEDRCLCPGPEFVTSGNLLAFDVVLVSGRGVIASSLIGAGPIVLPILSLRIILALLKESSSPS